VIRKLTKQTGFTLFELLVAMAVFGVVSYMAYTGLAQILQAREQITITQDRLANIQLAFLNLERDLQHVVKRPIRNSFGDYVGEVVGDELADYRLAITRGGRHVPNDFPMSNLMRVGYVLEDETLYRISWPVLDQAQDTQPRKKRILMNVENVEVRFLSAKGEWETSWDSAETPIDQEQNSQAMGIPRAVAVKITIKDYGAINRMFLMPEV